MQSSVEEIPMQPSLERLAMQSSAEGIAMQSSVEGIAMQSFVTRITMQPSVKNHNAIINIVNSWVCVRNRVPLRIFFENELRILLGTMLQIYCYTLNIETAKWYTF